MAMAKRWSGAVRSRSKVVYSCVTNRTEDVSFQASTKIAEHMYLNLLLGEHDVLLYVAVSDLVPIRLSQLLVCRPFATRGYDGSHH